MQAKSIYNLLLLVLVDEEHLCLKRIETDVAEFSQLMTARTNARDPRIQELRRRLLIARDYVRQVQASQPARVAEIRDRLDAEMAAYGQI